jgi:hypothetical protein
MVQGTIKWTSGLVTPDDGSRNVFLGFSSAIASPCISHGQGGFTVKDAIAPTRLRYQVASKVEVRTRYQRGLWAGGYEIAEVLESGYRIRRLGSRDTLQDIFVPSDVREPGD